MSSIKSPDKLGIIEEEKNKIESSTLYLVGTPIGNLSDMSPRAIKVLSEVDIVAAEDTRNSGRLLAYFGIKKPMISYFEHNKKERGEEIIKKIKEGASVALITDAGMPAISDPGEDLVRQCANEKINVYVVPGPSAVVSALALSGLSTQRFVFEGFLSTAKAERRMALDNLKSETRTIIFYEAPHKLIQTLEDLKSVFGNRKISLCRELTKLNEEVIRTTIDSAIEKYKNELPRGEYVLVVEGASKEELVEMAFWSKMSVEEHVEYYISMGNSKNDSIKLVAKDRGVGKSEIYNKVMIK